MSDSDREALINRLRRAYEAFSRGDFDAAIEIAHPEIEFLPPGGAINGKAALRAWAEPDAMEDQRIQPLTSGSMATGSWSARTPEPAARRPESS